MCSCTDWYGYISPSIQSMHPTSATCANRIITVCVASKKREAGKCLKRPYLGRGLIAPSQEVMSYEILHPSTSTSIWIGGLVSSSLSLWGNDHRTTTRPSVWSASRAQDPLWSRADCPVPFYILPPLTGTFECKVATRNSRREQIILGQQRTLLGGLDRHWTKWAVEV